MTLTVALAAITGTYNGTVVLTDKIPHTSYRLVVEGQGRPGFVKGSSAIALRADGASTAVDVSGTVQTGGPIARVGQRLIGGVAKMMLDRFFACLQAKLGRTRVLTRLRTLPAGALQRAPGEDGNHRAPIFLAGMDVGVDVLQVGAREPRGGLDAAHGQRFPCERLLHVGQARRVRARTGHADSRRLNRPVLHVQRGRHPDDGEM